MCGQVTGAQGFTDLTFIWVHDLGGIHVGFKTVITWNSMQLFVHKQFSVEGIHGFPPHTGICDARWNKIPDLQERWCSVGFQPRQPARVTWEAQEHCCCVGHSLSQGAQHLWQKRKGSSEEPSDSDLSLSRCVTLNSHGAFLISSSVGWSSTHHPWGHGENHNDVTNA